MAKLKYIIAIALLLFIARDAIALEIQYGTVLGTKGSTFLVQYYGIDAKKNFLCNVTTKACSTTKKTTLGTTTKTTLKKSLQAELRDRGAGHITLSPSAKLVAYYIAGDYAKPTRTYTVRDITTGTESSIADGVSYWDLVNDEGKVFEFSPDNTKLGYIDDKDGQMSLYIANTKTITPGTLASAKLATSAYQVDDFLFTDSDTLYYVGNTKENPYAWSLYRYDMKKNSDAILAKNVSYVDPLKRIGKAIVFNQLQAKGYGPAMYNLSTKKVELFSIPGISTKAAIANEEVIQSASVHGVLMTPTKYDKTKSYPLLVWLHGGPYRQTSFEYHPYHSYGIYDSILELLRKNNVVVLKLDYPGSFGLGRNYAESIKGDVGTMDVNNVLDAIAYAKNRYQIGQVYLGGNSYGGYLSLKTLVDHPTILTGVISINGVTDWESLLVKMQTSIFNTHFNGLPDASNRALYDQASIFNKIVNITNQKILVVQGQSDRTIPAWQADLFAEKLQAQNKAFSIVKYKGEDHVFKGKKAINDLCVQMFTFVGAPIDSGCTK